MINLDKGVNDMNLEQFEKTMQDNIEISDASGSSIFSICGMALRLRDLNKWEKGLNPWEENDPKELVDWIDQKEQQWDIIEGQAFSSLPFMGKNYDPFDTCTINKRLSPFKLFYGAGYAHSLKPTFFLASIDQTFDLDGTPILILEKELLRDLLTLPALNQDDSIIVRRDAARLFLWDQMVYLKKSGQRFLHFALKQCGLPDTDIKSRKTHFDSILSVQEQTYIHHEIGEINDVIFDRKIFRELVSQFPHSTVELLTRTTKDLLADTGPQSTLGHIISTRNAAGLGFYAAFQDGLFRPLFPQLRPAIEKFVSDKDWEGIETVRQKGFQTAKQYAQDLMDIFYEVSNKLNKLDKSYQKDMKSMEEKINKILFQPLIERSI